MSWADYNVLLYKIYGVCPRQIGQRYRGVSITGGPSKVVQRRMGTLSWPLRNVVQGACVFAIGLQPRRNLSVVTYVHRTLGGPSWRSLAADELDDTQLPPRGLLTSSKGQAHAERGVRFLKAPPLLASSRSRKKPERLSALLRRMPVCWLVYAALA
jgi:hypothetical protein